MKYRYTRPAFLLIIGLVIVMGGCSLNAPFPPETTTDQLNQAPVQLVWPEPPEIPRIRFLYSLSEAKDLNISQGILYKIFRFLKGDVQKTIVQPHGIKKDAEGKLYVVDTYHKIIHVLDEKESQYYFFPKEPIKGFLNPINIAIGSNDRVYISDSESGQIHLFKDSGKTYLKSFGGDVLKRPTDLIFNDNDANLYVVDTLASNIVVFDEEHLHARRVEGINSHGDDGFHFPTAITLAKNDHFYVTDSLNFRVQELSSNLEFLNRFGIAGDGPGTFARPKGIASDSEGNIYVVDALFGNIQIFDKQRQLLLAFGKPGHQPGEFWLPNEIFIDDQDQIYISDAYNNRVQVFQYLSYGLGE